MKLNKLNDRGIAHWALPLTVVALASVVGVRLVLFSSAAPIPKPTPQNGPKGIPLSDNDHLSKASLNDYGQVKFFYAGVKLQGKAQGASVKLSQHRPMLAPSDYHSLAELAAISDDGKEIVEVGWTVDRAYGGKLPRLFVYHWVDGAQTCYNDCGFVQVSRNVRPGNAVKIGSYGTYKIVHAQNKWWIYYNGEKIGYFADWLWGDRYTELGWAYAFGEVAVSSSTTCTDMGNGVSGKKSGSARIKSFGMVDGSVKNISTYSDEYTGYSLKLATNSIFAYNRDARFGGPGSC
jgi:hypothetical protein